MPAVKIKIYKGDDQHLASTVTIPERVFRIAAKLMPVRAVAALREQGIDLEEVSNLAANPEVTGPIVSVEDHDKHERVVVTLE